MGKSYRCLVTALFLLFIMTAAAFSQPEVITENTFTGAINNKWSEPGNWSSGYIPHREENVTIPEGKTVVISAKDNYLGVHVFGLENKGTITVNGARTGFGGFEIKAERNVTNSGTIESPDGGLAIRGHFLENNGKIEAQEQNLIYVETNVTNDGFGQISGGSVVIYGGRIDNDGTITSGNGDGDRPGGDITLTAQYVSNRGMIRLGDGGMKSRGGKGKINAEEVTCYPGSYLFGGFGALFGGIIEISVNGKIRMAGESATGTGIPAGNDSFGKKASVDLDQYTYYKLVGDTVLFNGEDAPTYGDYIFVRANVIQLEGDNSTNLLMAENGITLETPAGGTIDFSKLTHEHLLSTTSGTIELYSDNIIPPAGGLESVSEQSVVQHASNDQQIEASLIYLGQTNTASEGSDTVFFKIQNTGTVEQNFDYTLSSQLGSLTASGSTSNLNPFEATVLEFYPSRPDGVTTDSTDTMTLIVSGADGFSDTLTVSVFISKDLISLVPDNPSQPESYTLLRAFPNPFNPSTRIVFTLPRMQKTQFSVVNARGELVSRRNLGDLNSGEHQIMWNGSEHASGHYYMIIETETGKWVTKVLLLK